MVPLKGTVSELVLRVLGRPSDSAFRPASGR